MRQAPVNKYSTSEWKPAVRERRHAEQVIVEEQEHRDFHDRHRKAPIEIFACDEAVASRKDRSEGKVRGLIGDGLPLGAALPFALGIDSARAEQRQHQELSKKSQEARKRQIAELAYAKLNYRG